MKDTYMYPAIFTADADGYAVEFPDLPGCATCADTEEEALKSAREVLSWHLWDRERSGEPIPEPAPVKTLAERLETEEYIVFVDVFMPTYRYARENKATKVTTTIPLWMKTEADHRKLNYSDLLKEAIREKLGDLPRI